MGEGNRGSCTGIAVMLGCVNMLGGLIFGYNTGVINGAGPLIYKEWGLEGEPTTQGLITSCILIGAFFGSLIGGPLADKFGRKIGVIALAAISVVFAPLLAIVPGSTHARVAILIVTRGLLGLGVGMSGIICPMYVSENAPIEKRGSLGILFQLAITIGIFLAYCGNAALEHVTHGWRIMFSLGAFPAICLLVLSFVIPESFVWQARRTGTGEHTSLLRTNDSPKQTTLGSDANDKRSRSNMNLSISMQLSLFVRSRSLYIGLVLAVAQQLTGINAFMFYSNSIFKSAGLNNPNLATIGLGGWNVLTTLVAIPLVDRLGRRPLLIFGTAIMTVACVALGLVYKLSSGTVLGVLAIVLLFIFVFAFEIGDGPLFWMVAHELFTPEIKTVGATTLNVAQWLFNIMLAFGFPGVKDKIDYNVFYIFGGFGAVCTTIMIFFLPETRVKQDP